MRDDLRTALAHGDPRKVRALINAGADVHYRDEHGYDALLAAVHGRDVLNDSRLIDLLKLLIDSGVSVNGTSTYNESAVRVLSRLGRFDAVQFLLAAGANPDDIRFTELIRAVAFGTVADVKKIIGRGVDLEERDYWERTAWLAAVQTGDISKAHTLLEHGAQRDVRGRCGKPPLFYAIENGHIPMLGWLLGIGIDIRQMDDFGDTALATAADTGNVQAVNVLLVAGADVNQNSDGRSALGDARTPEVAMRLLHAGADPQELTSEARRSLLGLPPEADESLFRVSVEEFQQHRSPRFGTRNPEVMNNPFWDDMIRSGVNAYRAIVHLTGKDAYLSESERHPVWCADRFGQSITFLTDGRIVQIAGEHEDYYDADFCIYNDVFVHDPAGGVTIYGYPEAVFPPTDFHTATLIGGHIYLIGSVGYLGRRQYGQTPVYRLNVSTFQMEQLETTGDKPGWIYKHRAVPVNDQEIQVTGGKVLASAEGAESSSENVAAFILNVETLIWAKAEKQN